MQSLYIPRFNIIVNNGIIPLTRAIVSFLNHIHNLGIPETEVCKPRYKKILINLIKDSFAQDISDINSCCISNIPISIYKIVFLFNINQLDKLEITNFIKPRVFYSLLKNLFNDLNKKEFSSCFVETEEDCFKSLSKNLEICTIHDDMPGGLLDQICIITESLL